MLEFAECKTILPPTEFISKCQEDVCNAFSETTTNEIVCSYLSDYVDRCRQSLGKGDILKKWREEMKCVPGCDKNEHFLSHFDPVAELCSSLSKSVPKSNDNFITGCACLPGFYRNQARI